MFLKKKMTLIKSISGIRGTIGGKPGESLSPVDIVKFSAAYGTWIRIKNTGAANVVIGRDARTSGPMISSLVIMTLRSLGINVTDLGFATTPTVEIAVKGTGSRGGIIITASHNTAQWNALKLLNENGEFISSSDGREILDLAEKGKFEFADEGAEGAIVNDHTWGQKHIDKIITLDLVDTEAIKKAKLRVAVDAINSVGGLVLPDLLKKLGVKKVIMLNGAADGNFSHNPEPLAENLSNISELVPGRKADLGFAVDPDVDRLAIVCEDGSMFGEEYTLVAVADFILSNTPGNTVSNLSSSRALKDITEGHGGRYYSSAVGEVNVVEEMKRREAVIGGEGNGGVIYPPLHYGRDALAGIALFLTHLARSGTRCSELRRRYPEYVMAKKKVEINPGTDFESILGIIREKCRDHPTDERDGLKIEYPEGWVLIRKSNTEPVIRIYAEERTRQKAENLAAEFISFIKG